MVVRCSEWALATINKIVKKKRVETSLYYGQRAVVDEAVKALIEREKYVLDEAKGKKK